MVSRNLERANENDGFKMTALEVRITFIYLPNEAQGAKYRELKFKTFHPWFDTVYCFGHYSTILLSTYAATHFSTFM